MQWMYRKRCANHAARCWSLEGPKQTLQSSVCWYLDLAMAFILAWTGQGVASSESNGIELQEILTYTAKWPSRKRIKNRSWCSIQPFGTVWWRSTADGIARPHWPQLCASQRASLEACLIGVMQFCQGTRFLMVLVSRGAQYSQFTFPTWMLNSLLCVIRRQTILHALEECSPNPTRFCNAGTIPWKNTSAQTFSNIGISTRVQIRHMELPPAEQNVGVTRSWHKHGFVWGCPGFYVFWSHPLPQGEVLWGRFCIWGGSLAKQAAVSFQGGCFAFLIFSVAQHGRASRPRVRNRLPQILVENSREGVSMLFFSANVAGYFLKQHVMTLDLLSWVLSDWRGDASRQRFDVGRRPGWQGWHVVTQKTWLLAGFGMLVPAHSDC